MGSKNMYGTSTKYIRTFSISQNIYRVPYSMKKKLHEEILSVNCNKLCIRFQWFKQLNNSKLEMKSRVYHDAISWLQVQKVQVLAIEGKPGYGKVRWPEAWDNVWPGTDRCGRWASCRTAGSAAQCYCSAGQTWTAPSLPLPVHKKHLGHCHYTCHQCCGSGSGRIRNFWPDPGKNMTDPDPGTSGSEMKIKLH